MTTSDPRLGDLRLDIVPFGPTVERLEGIGQEILQHDEIRKAVGRGKHRLLGIEAVEPKEREKGRSKPREPEDFRATIYDYAADRVLLVEGRIGDLGRLTMSESAEQPPVTDEEFWEAADFVKSHPDIPEIARAISEGHLIIYRPMPLLDLQELDGRTRRVIALGLFDKRQRRPEEILGVEIGHGRLHRFGHRAPEGSRPQNNSICGAPGSASESTASKGTAGQVWVTVKRGRETLWRFLAVRPAASSGLRGSGVELRFVDYRGKRVLYRAHVPILNVRYDRDACGPYRDWQWQEGKIQANGTNVAPGFRLCSSPAKTIMDTGSDVGNFLGVGIYVEGQEVVLVSEMEAGWYRYVSQWRLHANGTIRPRFGFAATDSPCVCNVHHHHVYWRFDFDIVTASNNRVLEFNDPPVVQNQHWHEKHFEIRRPRDPTHKRKWRVENTASGAAYDVVPRPDDGIASQLPDWPYGRGDVWVLRYHGNEIDDGFNTTTSPNSDAKIDQWINGEAIIGRDVVIWYGAHFTHDVAHEDPAQHGHVVGPDLVPVNWPR
ncbi:copper amine oxidase [Microvirga yunnanensis]|uniref:copper amine oxidase n=1 Tax=Microvirga yunnanensis TaxID=2953740 RepID=UPI0021C8CDAE|nr:hypothetical protein [Microvirga sp. HBU65207]